MKSTKTDEKRREGGAEMRKFLIVVLALLLLCMAGCAAQNRDNGNSVPKITKQQQKKLDTYYDIVSALTSYTDTGVLQLTDPESGQALTGQAALQYAYFSLLTLGEIDDFIGTKWHDPRDYLTEIQWDRKQVLKAFYKVKDVLLSVEESRTDIDGTVTREPESYAWQYHPDGTVAVSHREAVIGLQALPNKAGGTHKYDASGRLEVITYRDEQGQVTEERRFVYDGEGRVAQLLQKNGQGTVIFTYSYDDSGHLSQISWEDALERSYTLAYTYDPQGNVLTETGTTWQISKGAHRYISDTYTMEYVYENGRLTKGALVYQMWHASWNTLDGQISENRPTAIRREAITFETDGKGNVVKKTVHGADLVSVATDQVLENAQYAQKETQYRYGDYLIYNPQ